MKAIRPHGSRENESVRLDEVPNPKLASGENERPNPQSADKPVVSEEPLKPMAKPARKRGRWPMVVGILVVALLFLKGCFAVR